MKALQCLITIFLVSASAKAIEHRVEIQQAAAWASTFDRPYPIHIFNRDEITYLFFKNNALEKEDEELRQRIIGDYVKEKVGIELSENDLSNLEVYLYTLSNSAVALPLTEGHGNDLKYKMCAVFPNAPNGNARIESERILGLLTKEVYPNEDYEQLTKKLSFEELYLFSLYHEVSHCLDKTFMRKTYINSEDSHGVHESESFAETLAYLGLIKRLGKDIASPRIFYRILYSRLMGEYFAKNPSLGFGNPHVLKGGVVYYLAPVLFAAYDKVASGKIKVEQMTPEELADAATEIVEQSSVYFRSFSAIARGLSEGFESVTDEYETRAYKDPQYFLQAYLDLNAYKNVTDLWIKNAFDQSVEVHDSPLTVPDIPFEDLCAAARESNKEQFLGILDDYRKLIREGQYSAHSMQLTYEALNDLGKSLSTSCAQ